VVVLFHVSVAQPMRLAAAERVRELDRERTRFVRDHVLKDPEDPRQYDLVLNTSHFSVTACADLITDALRQRQGAPVGG